MSDVGHSSKWYQTVARLRDTTVPVSPVTGTFSFPGVEVYPGGNTVDVTVTDVSGNQATQTRNFIRTNGVLEHFTHDANGNLVQWVSGTQTWTYEWDWADRLTKVSSSGVVLLLNWYDANSRRVAKLESVNSQTKKWLYLYDGWDIVGVMNEVGAIQETFTRGVGLAGDIGTLVAVTRHVSPNAGTHYTHHNHRGDIVLVRTGTTTSATYGYSAFGTLTTQTGTDLCRFRFSSKEREATCGFSYYGYRFYAPQWQRWINRDPIGEDGGHNVHRFVANNPLTRFDPRGLAYVGDDGEVQMPGRRLPPMSPGGMPPCVKDCIKDCAAAHLPLRGVCVVGCIGTTVGYFACLGGCMLGTGISQAICTAACIAGSL